MAIVVRRQQVDFRSVTLERLSEKIRESTAWLKDYITAIKHGQLHPFTPMERKAREATRNEPWGPTGTMLNDLAEQSFDRTNCEIIFAVLVLRLGYPPEKWRNVYKALTVLEFLLKRGSDQCVTLAREEMMYRLEDLEKFQYSAADGRDQGINVRHRAQAIRVLLNDQGHLDREREIYKAKRKQYQGFSREEMLSSSSAPVGKIQESMGRRRSYHDGEPLSPQSTGHAPLHEAPAEITPVRGKNAGEMKGVTLEENKKHVEALKLLLQRPENRSCADCRDGGAASRPSWASISTGVFICMRCAGIHRGLGVHISKVRSVTLDTWLPEQVAFMAATGNGVANAFWEAKLQPGTKPHYDAPELGTFIRRKYNKEFADGVWPPASTLATPQRVSQPESTQSAGAASSPAEEADTGRAGTAAPSTLAGSFWTSSVNVETSSATLIEFDSIQERQGVSASLDTPDQTVQGWTGKGRPLRPGTKVPARPTPVMVQSAVGTPAHPSQIAGTFSPPFGAGNSAPPQVASTPAQAVPRTSYPAVASSIPAATSLHPATGFDELLASVGLSLMDKDYSLATPAPRFAECSSVPTLQQNLFHSSAGATVGSTIPDPLSAYTTGRSLASPPVQPGASAITGQPPGHHLGLPAGSHVAMQQVLGGPANSSGLSNTAATIPSPSPSSDCSTWPPPPQTSFTAVPLWGPYAGLEHQASWFGGPESLTPASSLAFEEDAAWSIHSGPPSGPVPDLDLRKSDCLLRDSMPLTSSTNTAIIVPPLPVARSSVGSTSQIFASPVPTAPHKQTTAKAYIEPARHVLETTALQPDLKSHLVMAEAPGYSQLQGLDRLQQDGSQASGNQQGWQQTGGSPAAREAFGFRPIDQTRGLASRRSGGFAPRNEMEAKAAREKEVLEDLFACALEDLRVSIPPHAKQRLIATVPHA